MSRLSHSLLIESARVESLRWFKQRQLLYIIVSLIGVVFLTQVVALVFVGSLGFIIGVERMVAVASDTSTATSEELTLFLIAAFLPFFLVGWIWVGFFERRSFSSNGLIAARPFLAYGRGLLIGLGMLLAVILIMSAMGYVVIEQPWNQLAIASALLVSLGWIVQGAAEEFLIRGFLMQIIGRRYGIIAAITVSSVIFAVAHGANSNITFLSIVNLTLYGVLMALYALWEGNLWGVFAIHSVWNWAQGNLFGFEVSGNQLRSGIVLDLGESGPDWLTGGPFGLEGGMITSVVLLATIAILLAVVLREGDSDQPQADQDAEDSEDNGLVNQIDEE
ncbi:MAG: CPBP family intramembrane glutamic endopeptidase [Chloroflexota bacterium]